LLDSISSATGITSISGMAFDKNNNLWVSSSYSTNILAVKTATNNWYNYNLPTSNKESAEYRKLVIDNNDFVWIQDNKNARVYVFDHNQSLDVVSDDRIITDLVFTANTEFTSVE